MSARVTPLLSIADDGMTDVDRATALLMVDKPVAVANSKTALDVLVRLGVNSDWATNRINLALTGEWVDS
jgi:alcohol dehydrogenase YqhD (iron-dependent ADH family)